MKKSLVLAAALLAGTAGADEQADTLIKHLGSGHYGTRIAAQKALSSKTDDDTRDKLLAAMKSQDTEVARRAAEILQPYLAVQKEKTILATMQKTRNDCQGKLPFIDTAGFDSQFWQTYMAKAKGNMNAPAYEKYRNAMELLIEDLLREGHPIEDLIEHMKSGELAWIENQNRHANPKIPPTWSPPTQ